MIKFLSISFFSEFAEFAEFEDGDDDNEDDDFIDDMLEEEGEGDGEIHVCLILPYSTFVCQQ